MLVAVRFCHSYSEGVTVPRPGVPRPGELQIIFLRLILNTILPTGWAAFWDKSLPFALLKKYLKIPQMCLHEKYILLYISQNVFFIRWLVQIPRWYKARKIICYSLLYICTSSLYWLHNLVAHVFWVDIVVNLLLSHMEFMRINRIMEDHIHSQMYKHINKVRFDSNQVFLTILKIFWPFGETKILICFLTAIYTWLPSNKWHLCTYQIFFFV